MTDTIVLGAGMVGICTALSLQTRGHNCVVVDRNEPGRETSYGNAGIIQAEAVQPYTLPRSLLELAALAWGRDNAVRCHWRSIPSQISSLLAYWAASGSRSLDAIVPIWSSLISEAVARHSALIEQAEAQPLIARDGYWKAHASEARLASAVAEAERLQRRHGIRFRVADRAELSQQEPALRVEGLAGAIHWSDPWRCLDPGGLVAAYAGLFERRGGRILRAAADALRSDGSGWKLAGESAERVVVALGPWSPGFLRRFGYRIPMVAKRGYHLHYRGDHGLRRPLLLVDHSIAISPMNRGLRIASGAELSSAQASAYPAQLARGEKAARSLLDFSDAVEERAWSGTRPCLSRMLPLVCEAPRHPGLWLHFGHGHQGFTLGPVTAEKMAQAMEGDRAAIAGLELAA